MAENGDLIPRFSRMFLSEMASESLEIPLSFVEYLDHPLPKNVKLQGIGGRFWTVSLTRIREAVYFTHGWPQFAEDHDLKNGEFLTFVYDGLCTFEVSVFDRWGCKETRAEIQAIQLSDTEEEEDEQETSMDVDDDNSYGEDEEISQSIPFVTTIKKMIKELLIPAKVVKDNHLTFGDSISFIDEEGTLVGLRAERGRNRLTFRGWNSICRRNRLKQHDTVQCELLHDQKRVHSIRVHVIHRAA